MTRDLGSDVAAEVVKGVVRPELLFAGEFASGTLRLWSGLGPLEWNGMTWMGAGHVTGVSSIQESDSITAAGVSVTLAGVRQEDVSLALSECRQGAPCTIYLVFFDENDAIIGEPYPAFRGRLDVPELDEGATTATITINYESRLIDLERPRERRYTDADQKIDYADDRGLEFVPALQDKVLVWGKS